MSLRKIWLIFLISISVISIATNSMILIVLTDRYFSDYLQDNYEMHLNQIVNYATKALAVEDRSYQQMYIELESHLNEPIVEIKLYDARDQLVVDVKKEINEKDLMMDGQMMSNHYSQETRQISLNFDGIKLGTLNIIINSFYENSYVEKKFKTSLLYNSLLAIAVSIIIAIVFGLLISKKMSKSLKETENLASDIQLGKNPKIFASDINEINGIRDNLMELNYRLKAKQINRKALIDQLVHQTRTPLTILKTRIESYDDGVVEFNSDEARICQVQINNIQDIIQNMSSIIDVESTKNTLQIENFELYNLLRQVQQGLIYQFTKKEIELIILSSDKVQIQSDKYKLSQAIYNILTNAYKYTHSKGRVTINYYVNNKIVYIEIQDNGIGIISQDIDKIFNAYYRSANGLDTNGDGLGLYIVKNNISSIKGEVKVKSELNRGSIFIIEIPQIIQ